MDPLLLPLNNLGLVSSDSPSPGGFRIRHALGHCVLTPAWKERATTNAGAEVGFMPRSGKEGDAMLWTFFCGGKFVPINSKLVAVLEICLGVHKPSFSWT